MSQWDDYHLADQVAATHVAERGVPRQRWSHVYNMYEMTQQIRGYEKFLLNTIERLVSGPNVYYRDQQTTANQSDGIRSRKSEYDKLRGFGLGFEKQAF